jgi:putative methyltransferase (TIGR04325 family)
MWSGDYPDWPSAMRHCTGYQAQEILERCREALHAVQSGKAPYERDSILFHDDRRSWEFLAVAYRAAIRNGGRLSVLDFGGALGSMFFQHRAWLDDIPAVHWHVVEQSHWIECGRRETHDARLRFFSSIEESVAASPPNVLLLSGVLQCLEEPYVWIDRFNRLAVPNIVLDRVPIVDGLDRDMLTAQHVHPGIYKASYPSWFFHEERFVAAFSSYQTVARFLAHDKNQWVDGRRCMFRGYVLNRLESVA